MIEGRPEKSLAWTLRQFDKLINAGMVQGPKVITPQGQDHFNELLAGYNPTDEEKELAARYFVEKVFGEKAENHKELILLLIHHT